MRPQHITPAKRCPNCGESKPATTEYFCRSSSTPSGLQSWCKACVHARHVANREDKAEYDRAYRQANLARITARKRAYHLANRKRDNERSRAYRAANPAAIIEQQRVYSSRNRERIRANAHRWYVKNREYALRRSKAYKEKNPQQVKASIAVQSAIKSGLLPPLTTQFCFVCAKQATEYHHVDYSKPLEVFPLCRSCHRRWHAADK